MVPSIEPYREAGPRCMTYREESREPASRLRRNRCRRLVRLARGNIPSGYLHRTTRLRERLQFPRLAIARNVARIRGADRLRFCQGLATVVSGWFPRHLSQRHLDLRRT